jgi:hypothetical protein
MVHVLLAERLCCVRVTAAIFVAALLLGAVPVPEIVGAFNAHDLRVGALPVPDGVAITSTINPANGVPVVRVDHASTERVWVPLFPLPASKLTDGEIRYRMTFDTDIPANCVQPGVRLEYASGDSVTTATPKNVGELKVAEPPLFTAEAMYWNRRDERPQSAVFGVMLYAPGTVNIEQAEIMALTEPFKGFTTESLLLTCVSCTFILVFGLGFLGLRSPGAARRRSAKSLVRSIFATVFVAGFFVLPQWESNWTVPFILCGAVGFLLADLPVRQSNWRRSPVSITRRP